MLHFKFKVVIRQNYVYDTNFFGNILIVGRTDCGKTFLTQKLAVNNFFGTLKKVEWVSTIELSAEREAESVVLIFTIQTD